MDEKLRYEEITRATYDRYFTDYTRFFGETELCKSEIRRVTEEDLEEFIRTTIREKKLSAKSYSGLRTLILGILKYAKKKKVFTKSEIKEIIKFIEKDNDENTGKYRHEVVEHPKTDAGRRAIVLTDLAIEYLRLIKSKSVNTDDFVFMKNGKRITEQMLTNKLYRICDALDIEKRSMNKARKTYASNLINANVDPAIIQLQMGHTDVQTTLQFYYANDKSENEITNQVIKALS